MNTTESVNPYPKEVDEKFTRIGWGNWEPTPGVTDEGREIYLTIHLHIMSVEEALVLSDEEFKQRLWEETLNPREALIRYQQRAGIIALPTSEDAARKRIDDLRAEIDRIETWLIDKENA